MRAVLGVHGVSVKIFKLFAFSPAVSYFSLVAYCLLLLPSPRFNSRLAKIPWTSGALIRETPLDVCSENGAIPSSDRRVWIKRTLVKSKCSKWN